MHILLRVLILADDKNEAEQKAQNFIENEYCNKEFDYCKLAEGNWGNNIKTSKYNTKEGKQLIDEGLNYTKQEFLRNLKEIRKILEVYSDEEIFEEEEDKEKNINEKVVYKLDNKELPNLNVKYPFNCLGQYGGNNIYVYGENWGGITNNNDLKNFLKDIDLNELWVVPIDAHY